MLPLLLSLLSSFGFAETLYASAPVEGVRWPDASAVTVKLAPGDEVEVLVRDGALARVRKGANFGWVAAASLTAEKPVVPEVDDSLPGELPAFDIVPADAP